MTANGCWNCVSHRDKVLLYPITKFNGKPTRISRLFYEKYVGTIPSGQVIRHKCDNRTCINPDHLIPGTTKDNSQDMVDRDRSLYGERHSLAKLTWSSVKEIRSSEMTNTGLAKKFNVTPTTIGYVRKNKIWNHPGKG